MSQTTLAILFDALATGITLIISSILAKRHPAKFLTSWILAHLFGVILLCAEMVHRFDRIPSLFLAMVALGFGRAWFLSETGCQIKPCTIPIPLKAGGLLVSFTISAGLLFAGAPYTVVGFLPILAIAFSLVHLGYLFLSKELQAPWLGWPLIALGLVNILYPVSHPQYGWIGYLIAAVIVMVVGMGMIIFVLEEKEKALKAATTAQIQALQEADRIKDQFLTVMSHELRTPLNAITGFGSVLQEEIAGPLTSTQKHLATQMLEGAERMMILISNLLDSARIQANKLDIQCERTNYPDLVEKTLVLLEPLIKRKKLTITSQIRLQEVTLDQQLIAQVLINLIGNAIKFSPPESPILIQASLEDEVLVTSVTDKGIGIAPENLAKLFSAFQQLDMSLTRKVGGSGLGLNISKGIIEAHGGRIEAMSPGLGQGSTFSFRIPVES